MLYHYIVEGRPLESVKDQMLEEERVFFRFLDSQLAMVDLFYRGKLPAVVCPPCRSHGILA